MSFMGVYFPEKGAASQLRSVYLIIEQLLTSTVVSAWLSILYLPWKGSPIILLMVRFVDDIFLSQVLISEVFRTLFVLCVLLYVYLLIQVFILNTIHSRHSTTQQISHFYYSVPSQYAPWSHYHPGCFPQWDSGRPPWWPFGNYGWNGGFHFRFFDG